MNRRAAAALAFAVAALAACGSSSPAPSSRPPAAATSSSGAATLPSRPTFVPSAGLCGFRATPPALYKHVIWLLQENASENLVVGFAGAPFVNQVLVPQCGLATNFHNVSHPSLTNYVGLTSGTAQGAAGSSNCAPSDCPQSQPSIFSQVQSSGAEWRQYAQSMDGPCSANKTSLYEPEHAVPVYYTNIADRCGQWDAPLGTPSAGALRADIDAGRLPAFAFVTPDGDHEKGSAGDQWLRDWISLLTGTREYREGDTAIFVTWDEGEGPDKSHGEACADQAHADTGVYPSCWVAALVISPTTRPGTTSATYLNHYALLRATEEMLGFSLLGHAGDAGTADMRPIFNL